MCGDGGGMMCGGGGGVMCGGGVEDLGFKLQRKEERREEKRMQ